MLIPKTIHYIWLGREPMPPLMNEWRERWAFLHPSWEIKIWNETDRLDQLTDGNGTIKCQHSTYLSKCPTLSKRSDVWRYNLLEQLGGLYLDTDFEPIKCIEEITFDKKAFAGKCQIKHSWTQEKPEGKIKTEVGCALIGTTPHHPWMKELVDNIESCDPVEQLSLAFPYLTKITKHHPEVHLFESDVFYPIRWDQLRENSQYKQPVPKSTYAVHQWSSNWFPNGLKLLRTKS